MQPDTDQHRHIEQNLSVLQPGDHLCCIYENKKQQAEIIVQYLGDALKQGQKILYLFDENDPDTILHTLKTAGVGFADALKRGQFQMVSSLETYLRGGEFDPQLALDLANLEVEKALAEGYPALRSTAEMTWINRSPLNLERLMEYETRQSELPFSSQAIVLCQYPRGQIDPQVLLQILFTHEKIAVGTSVYENFYSLPSIHYLHPSRAADRFDHYLSNLARRNQRENELERSRGDLAGQSLEEMVTQRTAQLQHEIRERQLVEEVLRESEGRYRALVNQAPLSILVAQDSRYVFVNPAIVHRLGYASAYDLIGKNVVDTISPESREIFLSRQENMLSGQSGDPVVTAFLCKDGSVYYSENTAVPIFYQGRPAMMVIGQDVTERLRYEQQLMSSLSEKEVMLREIHHRVKNNLNVIIALIDLQKANRNDPQVLHIFKELQARVYSMALVHESLFRSPNLAEIDFAGYLQTLVSYLYSGYGPVTDSLDVPPVQMKVVAENLPLRVETAIPCGLIVNELITNSLKYAFPGGFAGRDGAGRQITVCLQYMPCREESACTEEPADRQVQLTISDNGIGLPDGLNWRSTTTLGLQLVQVLARQLGAQLTLDAGPGVTWNIIFAERSKDKV